ncbi:MAG: hypothetical protein MUD17_00135 [Gemmatimonadaceae bacterium]|jgi:hypothetical protein|nr:hypothetical protein [Gemmatimonadaceae bacterium]
MAGHYSLSTFVVGALASLLLAAAMPKTSLAQGKDCGSNCGSCGTGKKEGFGYHELGEYNMTCAEAVTGCFRCWGQHTLVRESPLSAEGLLRAIRTSSLDDLVRLAPSLKGQVFVYPQRKMVAVRGEECAKDRIVALAFLPQDRIDVLTRRGIGDLAQFLDQGSVASR